MAKTGPGRPQVEEPFLYRLSEAADILSVSIPTLKRWLAQGRVHSIRTPGGHHRIPQSEIGRLVGLPARRAVRGARPAEQAAISGRNKLFGKVTAVKLGGLLAEIIIDLGGQTLTAIITSESCKALGLRPGVSAYGLIKATEVMVGRP